MNLLWAGMMLAAIVYGAINGTIPEVTQAALDSSKEAVTLCITMLGILSFWMGLMQIANAAGLIKRLTRWIQPVLCWLFPRIPKGHPAMGQIAVNCIANASMIIGLNKEPFMKRLYLVLLYFQYLIYKRRQAKNSRIITINHIGVFYRKVFCPALRTFISDRA